MTISYFNIRGGAIPTYPEMLALADPEWRMNYISPYNNDGTEPGTYSLTNTANITQGISPTPTGEGGLHLNPGYYAGGATAGIVTSATGFDITDNAIVTDIGTFFCVFRPEAGMSGPGYIWNVNEGFDESQIGVIIGPDESLSLLVEDDGGNNNDSFTWQVATIPEQGAPDFYDGNWHSLMICKHSTGTGSDIPTEYITCWVDGVNVNDSKWQALFLRRNFPVNFWLQSPDWNDVAVRVEMGRRGGAFADIWSGELDEWFYAVDYVPTDAEALDFHRSLGLTEHSGVQTESTARNRSIELQGLHRWSLQETSGNLNDSGMENQLNHQDLTSLTGVSYSTVGPWTGSTCITFSGASTARALDPNDGSMGNGWTVGGFSGFFRRHTDAAAMELLAHGNSGGGYVTRIRLLPNTDPTAPSGIFVQVRSNGSGNQIDWGLNVPVSLNDWHYMAVIQDGVSGGIRIFFDGTWYTIADAEMTVRSLTGTATVNDWVGSLVSRDRFALGGAATTTGTAGFDGDLTEVVWDDSVWTDAAVEAIWTDAEPYLL